MAPARLRPVIDYLRALALRPRPDDCSDGWLLARFVADRDESAFAALVHRHGPMVFAVCRRVLHDAHDAEDCFQAVFLVLSRKAASLRNPERLSNWLYGVAHRTALKARRRGSRRRKHESPLVDVPVFRGDDLDGRELRSVLDEEIARLPARYRTPVVLCYLEGATNAEAARRLGWARGTVATRLAWARQRLRMRLTRRGITLPAGAVAALLSHEAAQAALPAGLAVRTIEVALLFAAGYTLSAGTTPVVILAKGVLTSMTLTKIQFAALMLLTACAVGVGTGWLVRSQSGGERPQATAPLAIPRAENDRDDGLKQEIAALRKELQDVKKSSASSSNAAPLPRAAETLLYQGKPASYWLAALRDRDWEFRAKAVAPLGSLAQVDHSLMPAIIECLKDDAPQIHELAATALCELGPAARAAVPALLQSRLPVDSVVSALEQIDPKGEKAVPAALAALKDTQPHVRRNVAFTLLAFDKSKTHLALGGFLEALKNKGEELTTISRDSTGGYHSVDEVAAYILGQMGPEAREAVPALVEGLRWGLKNVRPGSGPTSPEPFASALKKIDPEGKIAVPLLAKMLDDRDVWNRQRASMALRVYGAKAESALPALLRCIKKKQQDEDVLVEAVRAIGAMGPAARSAVPILRHIENHQRQSLRSPGLHSAAAEALNQIDPETPKKAGVSDTDRPKKPKSKESPEPSDPH